MRHFGGPPDFREYLDFCQGTAPRGGVRFFPAWNRKSDRGWRLAG